MHTRGTDAIPLAPRPSLEQYRKQAKDLVKASRTGDIGAVRAWAADWIKRLARLHDLTATPARVVEGAPTYLNWTQINREVNGILDDVRQSRLVASDDRPAKPTLTEAQLVIARLNGFESWSNLACTSMNAKFRDIANSTWARRAVTPSAAFCTCRTSPARKSRTPCCAN